MRPSSKSPTAEAFPKMGVESESLRNPIRKRMEQIKREALEGELGKGESWATKVLNGESGVRLDDLPALLQALGLKVVDITKTCFPAELAKSYETIVRAAVSDRSLLFEDAE